MGKRLRSTGGKLIPAAFLLLLGGLWEVGVRIFRVRDYVLPAPSAIAWALEENFSLLAWHSRVTALEALVGLGLAIVIALVLAMLMDRFAVVKRMLYPVFVISQTIPIMALAPVMMIWFGLGILPKVMIVILVCFFPLVVSITEGLSGVEPDLINLMRVMGASEWKIMTAVRLPAALPSFFSGLRIAATYSVTGAVIGEWLGGSSGLGLYMTRAMRTFRTANLFAAIVVVVVLSIAIFQLVELAARLAMPWDRTREKPEDN